MAINETIENIKENIKKAYTALETKANKEITVNKNLENLSTVIEELETGKGGEYNIEVVDLGETQELHITDWDYEPPKFDPVFGNNTPAQISAISAEISANGYTSAQVAEIYGWNLGDKISIPLSTGENIEMQIIGINHDTKTSGGNVGLTLQMVDCLATQYAMEPNNTNSVGYSGSQMNISTLPTIKALLPKDWQDAIKFVNKKSANAGGSSYTETITISSDLFLLSIIEIFGSANDGKTAGGENEGQWYKYYEINNSQSGRIKKRDTNGDGAVDNSNYWWTRSVHSANNFYFRAIDTTGDIGTYTAAKNEYGVAFAFCI